MLTIEVEQEEDGRWIAEAPALPGALGLWSDRRPKRAGEPPHWHGG